MTVKVTEVIPQKRISEEVSRCADCPLSYSLGKELFCSKLESMGDSYPIVPWWHISSACPFKKNTRNKRTK